MGPRLLGRGRSFDEPGLHRRLAGRSHAGAAGWAMARVVEHVSRLPGLPVRAASTWTRARSLLACSALISAPPPPAHYRVSSRVSALHDAAAVYQSARLMWREQTAPPSPPKKKKTLADYIQQRRRTSCSPSRASQAARRGISAPRLCTPGLRCSPCAGQSTS